MSDLEVATQELRRLGARLRQLRDDLKSHDGGSSYGTDELAHAGVLRAMEEFRDNWDDNRAHLADKLGKLGELATQTADGFEEADAGLAREVVTAMEQSR
jgi:hypothetical protein